MFNKQVLDSFNELDFAIYNTVVRNGLRATRLPIKQLADEAHVSTASVVRFCKKCGCKGYAEFRLRYRESLQQKAPHQIIPENQTLANFLAYSESQEFSAAIDSAFQYLQAATQILILGVGSSGFLAKFGARILCDAGYFSLAIDDPFLPAFRLFTPNPVVLAVSFSGKTEQVLHMAAHFLENGCKLISITNTGDSPLAKLSDVNIAYYVPDIPVNGAFLHGSEVPVAYIFERLAHMLYQHRTPLSEASQADAP